MRRHRTYAESGFSMVELTVVVVISSLVLLAVFQTLITQERTYRYQTAAIETQGSTRTGLALLVSELREISASAGANMSGSDLIAIGPDSIRFRAFRKVGIVCSFNRLGSSLDMWVFGTPFDGDDRLLIFQEGDSITDTDDRWAVADADVTSPADPSCDDPPWATWQFDTIQGLQNLVAVTATIERGALVRSFETLTYGAFQNDEGEWMLGRRDPDNGEWVTLVGPTLPPDQGGVAFRYFNASNSSTTVPGQISRIQITVRALSQGGLGGEYVDSLTTNVYLRGN